MHIDEEILLLPRPRSSWFGHRTGGFNVELDPRREGGRARNRAFVSFSSTTCPGQRIAAQMLSPCLIEEGGGKGGRGFAKVRSTADPTFNCGDRLTDERNRPEQGATSTFVLANHSHLPAPSDGSFRLPSHVVATEIRCRS